MDNVKDRFDDSEIDWSPSMMLEVDLAEPEDFLKIKETLTRIGVASRKPGKQPRLFQSCHILHKQGRYFITHFKEMFALDGRPSSLIANDIHRRNTIAQLLDDWGLLTIVDGSQVKDQVSLKQIKVISFHDKSNWDLVAKYNIGVR